MIDVFVYGEPAPQGSKRALPLGGKAGGKTILVESSKKVAPWREAVARAIAQLPPGCRGLDGPLSAKITWYLRAPTSLSKKKLALGPCRKPDGDKLLRSTWDGITQGGGWADDARVVWFIGFKQFALGNQPTGAHIVVRRID